MTRKTRRPRKRLPRLLALFALVASLAALRFRPRPYDPLMGLGDYEQLRHYMGDLYANLDWSAIEGRADLRELHAETYHALAYARSQEQAGLILRGFVRSFQDPHMWLRWASSPPVDPPPSTESLSRFTTPEKACAALGYSEVEDTFAFTIDEKSGFHRLSGSNSFPAALLDAGEQRFGFLRIGSFAEQDYRGACLREWPRFGQALPGTCEEDCQRDFRISVSSRILRELAWRVRELRQAGAGALVIDVTGNHGGYPWYRRAAEILAPGPVLPFRAAVVRGDHAAWSLRDDRQRLSHYIATHRLAPADRAIFDQAFCRLDDLIAEAEQPCGAGAIWTGEPWKLGCSRLTTRPRFATGLFESDPGTDVPFEVARILYIDHVYPLVPSAWSGPVAVLVDEHTTSAAELFAASLKFSAGAILLGRHTASSGSGWSLGRRPWTLLRTRMNLYLPDTVEYWPDGANAREGLEPDIRILPRPRDHPDLTARWLVRILPSLGLSKSTGPL